MIILVDLESFIQVLSDVMIFVLSTTGQVKTLQQKNPILLARPSKTGLLKLTS